MTAHHHTGMAWRDRSLLDRAARATAWAIACAILAPFLIAAYVTCIAVMGVFAIVEFVMTALAVP